MTLILTLIQKGQSAPSVSSRVNRGDECNRIALQTAAQDYARSVHLRFMSKDLQCDAPWAVMIGALEDPNAPNDGPLGVGATLIFHREGSHWKHQVAASVCGTLNPEHPETRPQDALIPPSLYYLACLIG